MEDTLETMRVASSAHKVTSRRVFIKRRSRLTLIDDEERASDSRLKTVARSRGSVHPIVRSFVHSQSFQDRLVLSDVIVTGG